MALTMADLRARLGEVVPRIREWSKLHRFWFEAAGVTLFALVALAIIGTVAMRRAESWREQARQLEALEDRMQSVVAAFEAPDSVEIASWGESEQALFRLSNRTAEPLTVAGLVSERADEVGIPNLQLRLVRNDTSAVPGSVRAGAWVAEPQGSTIVAHFSSDLAAVARFVAALPPHVEVASIRLTPAGGQVRSEFRLIVRSLSGPS